MLHSRLFSPPDLLVILGIVALLFGARKPPRFRGGPTPPSHPLPSDDSVILNKRHQARTKIGRLNVCPTVIRKLLKAKGGAGGFACVWRH